MDKDIKVFIDTLGCKLNQAESEELSRGLMQAGGLMASSMEEADIYILNTCSVTREAERKSRQLLRRARHLNQKAKICATGCYARRSPHEIDTTGITGILNNTVKIEQLISSCHPGTGAYLARLPYSIQMRARSMLKIQEGCNYKCTYCVVPSTRGHERSVPLNQIIDDLKTRVLEGYRETVLTGTRIGSYEHNGRNLKELISSILSQTEIKRIRLSSLQPQEIDGELLALWKDKRLCPHFHIPLQSGSDRILHKMGRRYSVSQYINCISQLQEQLPTASITTDIIVGFPEERPEDFEESLALCQKIGFAKIHVFPFSPREGTTAASTEKQLDIKIIRERSKQILELSRDLHQKYLEKAVNRNFEVLWEREIDTGFWSGLTENYIRVYSRNRGNMRNSISPVKIKGLYRDGLMSEIY